MRESRTTPTPVTWVVAGGGTGGHVTMALALGEEIARRGDDVLFVGSARGLEVKLVPKAGFELVQLPAQPLLGRPLFASVAGALALAGASAQALALLRRRRAKLVLSVGGYASAPASAAAVLARVPLVLVEPNAIPGRTNRSMARFAVRVFTAFEAAVAPFVATLGRERVLALGAPLRRDLREAFVNAPARRRPSAPFRVLVVGGKPGRAPAQRRHDRSAPLSRSRTLRVLPPVGCGRSRTRRHRLCARRLQGGGGRLRAEAARTLPLGGRRSVSGGRAHGGGARARRTARAARSLPHAADDHQRANARSLADAGAARVLDPSSFDGKQLSDALAALCEEPDTLREMGAAAQSLARPDAAARIIDACLGLLPPRPATGDPR